MTGAKDASGDVILNCPGEGQGCRCACAGCKFACGAHDPATLWDADKGEQ